MKDSMSCTQVVVCRTTNRLCQVWLGPLGRLFSLGLCLLVQLAWAHLVGLSSSLCQCTRLITPLGLQPKLRHWLWDCQRRERRRVWEKDSRRRYPWAFRISTVPTDDRKLPSPHVIIFLKV
jgi:hypothetical protein